MRTVQAQIEQYVANGAPVPPEAAVAARNISEPGLLADMVAYSPDMTTEQRQELLETIDVTERLKLVSQLPRPPDRDPRAQGPDPVRGQVRDGQDPARVHPARAAQGHPARAGRGRPAAGRDQRASREGRGRRHAGGDQGPGDQGSRPDEPDPVGLARGRGHPDLRRLADRPALERRDRRPARHQGSRPDPRRGPLRPREDQGADPRVPRRAHPRRRDPQPDPRLRRTSRRRQDVARQEHRPGDGPQVRPDEPRRHPRRGRDPRPPPDLHRRAARPDHPEHQDGRLQQPGVHARRGRQDRDGLPGRPALGPPRGPRPRAEQHLPGQLPRGAVRPLARCSSSRPPTCSTRSRRPCATGWRSSSCPATPSRRRSRSASGSSSPSR